MEKSALIALLSGSEMTDSDNVVILTADGTAHAVTSITRTGTVETTLPSGVPDVPPVITIQLA